MTDTPSCAESHEDACRRHVCSSCSFSRSCMHERVEPEGMCLMESHRSPGAGESTRTNARTQRMQAMHARQNAAPVACTSARHAHGDESSRRRSRKDLLAIQRRHDFVLQTPKLLARGAILVPRLGAAAIDCGERTPYLRSRPRGSRRPCAARRAPAFPLPFARPNLSFAGHLRVRN